VRSIEISKCPEKDNLGLECLCARPVADDKLFVQAEHALAVCEWTRASSLMMAILASGIRRRSLYGCLTVVVSMTTSYPNLSLLGIFRGAAL
jgi:hypothetical protein